MAISQSIRSAFAQYRNAQWSTMTLACVRILFGLAMLISCIRFISLGWVYEQYIAPTMHFPYLGFEWLTPLPGIGMYLVFAGMTLAALCIMLGLYYRPAAILFFLAFTYVELLDKTYYLNHYYFVSVIAFLLCFLPAHRVFSLDVLRRPTLRLTRIPRWMVDLVKLQIALVYVFAGIAKINPDWLLHAMPLAIWSPAHDDLPLIGPLLRLQWMPYVFSWAGMLFDCTVPLFLMHRKTRLVAYCAVVAFHTVTGMMFQIGVFPIVMIALTLVFFVGKAKPADVQRVELERDDVLVRVHGRRKRWLSGAIATAVAVFVAVQILVPLRYLLYSGNVFWSEAGYRFSWRVMLMEKAGYATFFVRDGNGQEGVVVNSEFLNTHQEKQMSMQPDMVLQFAHYLSDYYRQHGMQRPRVRAEVWVTLNGQPSKMLVDPHVDLASESDGLHEYSWVLANE